MTGISTDGVQFFGTFMRPSTDGRYGKRKHRGKVKQTSLAEIDKVRHLKPSYFGDLGWGSWTDGVTPAAFSSGSTLAGFAEMVEQVRVRVISRVGEEHIDVAKMPRGGRARAPRSTPFARSE